MLVVVNVLDVVGSAIRSKLHVRIPSNFIKFYIVWLCGEFHFVVVNVNCNTDCRGSG